MMLGDQCACRPGSHSRTGRPLGRPLGPGRRLGLEASPLRLEAHSRGAAGDHVHAQPGGSLLLHTSLHTTAHELKPESSTEAQKPESSTESSCNGFNTVYALAIFTATMSWTLPGSGSLTLRGPSYSPKDHGQHCEDLRQPVFGRPVRSRGRGTHETTPHTHTNKSALSLL